MSALARYGLLLACAPLWACSPPDAARLLEVRGETMGTTYSVKVARPPEPLTRAALAALAAEVLERVDARMSTWRDDSELVRFNRAQTTDWYGVSEETAFVTAEALRVSELSGGAFDPTVGPLVALWGFGPGQGASVPPASRRVAETLEYVGFRHLQVRRSPPALRKERPRLELDLSGVAKGYAVDALVERLMSGSIDDFLVEIGGELRAQGRNANARPWRVAIERPLLARGGIQSIMSLRDVAVATSGSYRNFVVRDGRRYSHILDPRAGQTMQSPLVSVSVIAATTARADALATALLVLGPKEGWELAVRERLAVLFLVQTDDGLTERATPEVEQYRAVRPTGRVD